MKVTSVRFKPVHTAGPEITLNFGASSLTDPFTVESISGLDTSTVDFVTMGYMHDDYFGDRPYKDALIKEREIAITVGLNPFVGASIGPVDLDTYSRLRDYLFRLVATTRRPEVEVHFINSEDDEDFMLIGNVIRVETDRFDENQTATVIVRSTENPVFVDATERTITPSNPTAETIDIWDPSSTAPHGAKVWLECVSSFDGSREVNLPDNMILYFDSLTEGVDVGDIVEITNFWDDRQIVLHKDGGPDIFVADAVRINATWPLIFPGNQDWSIDTDHFNWVWIKHRPTRWGI